MKIRHLVPLLFLGMVACISITDRQEKKQISVSILPQKYFVERIAGDMYDVHVLVPPGASHETYEPSPQDLINVSHSFVCFLTGNLSLEKAVIDKIKTYHSSVEFVNTSEGIVLIRGGEAGEAEQHMDGGVDPHIWLSPAEVRIQALSILNTLCRLEPAMKGYFTENYNNFIADLNILDTFIQKSFTHLKRKKFIIFHPALAYYARDYGLEQLSLEWEGKSPSVNHMKELIDIAKREGIKTIFLQVQFDHHNSEAMAREIGGKLVELDPVPAKWLDKMYEMTNKLKAALEE